MSYDFSYKKKKCVIIALKINSNKDFFFFWFLKKESGRASFEFGGCGTLGGLRIKMEKGTLKIWVRGRMVR